MFSTTSVLGRIAIVAIIGAATVACAPIRPMQQVLHYTRADTTQAQFMKDRYECLQESQQRVSAAAVNAYGGASSSQVVASCSVWASCLGARGYVVDPYGNLAAPPGMVVPCSR